MAKIKILSGDIFRITLPHNLGFAYAKYIDLLAIDPKHEYPNLVRVYNFRSLTGNENMLDLVKHDLLFNPLLIAGVPQAVKGRIWQLVGNIPVETGEMEIPHYKFCVPSEILDDDIDQETKKWYYAINLKKFTQRVESRYDHVKHLETLALTGASLVNTKIAMGLIRGEGKKIEDYFALDEFFEKAYYNQVTRIPAYHTQPKAMRGKAIGS